MSFEFFISSRYLKAKQKQAFISLTTLLSIAGVCVGVMALIIVISVMAGFETDLKNRIMGVESHLILMKYDSNFSNYKPVINYVKTIDGVEAVMPFVYTQVMLKSNIVSGAVLRGIDPDSANGVLKILDKKYLENLKQRSEKSGANFPGIILGQELAANLGLSEGSFVYVISPKGSLSPIGHVPSMKKFEVLGFFKSGMYEYDGSIAYVNLKDAQKILHTQNEDSITGLEIRLKDIYEAKKIGQAITKHLGFGYWAKDWMQMNKNLFSALKLEKIVMFIILALIVLVAAFNIASSLIMMVMEKTKDIAILKAMGATNKSIRKIFVFKGMLIGSIGTFIGVLLGALLCMLLKKYKFIELPPDVYYISTLPVQMDWLDVSIIAVGSMLICFIATIYPAYQASKLSPVEALRYG